MILKIFGLIIGWLVAGTVLNYIAYYDTPMEQRGNNKNVGTLHKVINIIAIVMFFLILTDG